MDLDQLVQFVPHIIQWVQDVFPREIQGIVLVLIAFAALAIGFFWHYSHVSVPVKFAAKKFSARQAKIREKAKSIGFDVEDVTRDVAKFGKDKLYTLSSETCARYRWAAPLRSSGRWELLCRPGEYSAALSTMGWIVQGTPPASHKRAIETIVSALGEPKDFLEIAVDGNTLNFYWLENGGMEGLAKLQMLMTVFLREG